MKYLDTVLPFVLTRDVELPSGKRIIGRTDFTLASEVSRLRPKGRPVLHERGYLLDNEFINAVFKRRGDGKLFVCRSVLPQFYCTAWAWHALLIMKSGSSASRLLRCFSAGAVIEEEHVRDFWNDFEIVSKATERRCIYCNAEVAEDDNQFFKCGEHFSYQHERGDLDYDKHNQVHDAFIPPEQE